MSIDDDIGRAINNQRARERELRVRLEELRWVDSQFAFPNEIEPALSERIKEYEAKLAGAEYYGD